MLKKALIATAAIGAFAISSPALAGKHGSSGGCYKRGCTSTSTSSSGGHTSTSGGNTSTSGGTTTSGGTKVPEPGMLGLMGAGLAGLGMLQLRRRKQTGK